jgi:hypothetical protein
MHDREVGVQVPVGVNNFHNFQTCYAAWLALSPVVKPQVREADHSPPTSAEVNKTWIYTFTLQYVSKA